MHTDLLKPESKNSSEPAPGQLVQLATDSAFINAIAGNPDLLVFNRGIEREALRVTPTGHLATTPHPDFLGSKLAHPKVTTDFSEAQLELITPVHLSPAAAVTDLTNIHRYIYSGLEEELLWSASMPCMLTDDESIPLAYYGESNLGRLKTTYRSGLGYRYGRGMQTICAVHYNFSLSDRFWDWLQQFEKSSESPKIFRSRRYFDLMRNFRRFSFLLTYLFGASPAVCNSFLKNKQHSLDSFDEATAYLANATSLRSGNLGYQSDTQAQNMNICYNSLEEYVTTLATAISTEYDAYKEIGIHVDGEYRQVNANILQSEAEFYSSIRAKSVPPPGENFLAYLSNEGVQYIEVRLLDVNPYLPLGIDESEIKFLDAFLLYCLITDSPQHDDQRCAEVRDNNLAIVYGGRGADLMLMDKAQARDFKSWGKEILEGVQEFGLLLDSLEGDDSYSRSVETQTARLNDPDMTPSGNILKDMAREQIPFFRFAMNRSLEHREYFKSMPLTQDEEKSFRITAEKSKDRQLTIERADDISFDDYLAQVSASYLPLRQT